MSPELQTLLDHMQPLRDAIQILRTAKGETVLYNDFSFFKNHHAQEYLIGQQQEIESQIAAYFEPEVAA